jgi:hypothetical protein
MRSFNLLALCVLVAGSCSATALRAASIGGDFIGNNGANGTMLATDVAGVVPQANYNDLAGNNSSNANLVDSTGAGTGAGITYAGNGIYIAHGGGGATGTQGGDEKLNSGFIYGTTHLAFTNIPYSTYDVYIYQLNDASGRQQTTTLTPAVGPAISFFGSSPNPEAVGQVDNNALTAYVYLQATSTTPGVFTDPANFVRFVGITGSSFTIDVSAPGNGYINGFQIVQIVPEPASLSLLGLGGLALLRRRS